MVLGMKEKKQTKKKEETAGWKKILLVAIGVIFVVAMILSGMGTGWITGMKSAQPGDSALVEYTIRDSDGNAIITTSPSVYNATLRSGRFVLYTNPLTAAVNASASTVTKVPAMNEYGQSQFGLFRPEMEAINQALTGMKKGESKVVPLDTSTYLIGNITFGDFDKIYGNETASQISAGDSFPLTYVEHPVVNLEENVTVPELYFLRIATVLGKQNDEIIYNYGYSQAEIRLDQISQ
jgi:hypothetical protein